MKKGWTYKKLGECFVSINNGANIKQIKGAIGIPITRIETLSNDKFNRDRMGFANIEDVTPYSSYILNEGDILMSHINSMKFLGRAVEYSKIGNEQIIHGMNLLKLVPTKDIISSFMIYQFQTSYFRNQIATISHQSVNQASFNITNLKCLKLIVPPLAEQQRIVSRLDSAFAHIDELKANAEKQLNEARALFQKALSKAMEPKEGWEEKKIRDVFKIVGGGTPSKSKSTYYNGNIPWATVRDMNCDYLNKTEYSISEEGLHNSSSNLIDKGEIIIATRVGLGKVCILSQATAINQDLKAIVPKGNNINRNFVYYFFKDKAKYIEDNGVGATVKGVKLTFIEKLDFPLVSPSEQQRIVSRLDSLSKNVKALEENQRKVMAECDALKQALLRKVFE